MRQILTAPIRALYSRELYREAAGWKPWLALLYLAYLLALCWVPPIFSMYRACAKFMATEAPEIIRQTPSVTIDHGHVSTDVAQPYVMRSKGAKPIVMIIDTSGQTTSLDGQDAQVLLTRNKVMMRKNNAETRIYDLSSVKHFHIDRIVLGKWLSIGSTWGPIALYPLAVIGAWIYRLIQALLYSLVALPLARSMQVSLRYGALLGLTVVAMTPAILVRTLLDMAKISFPFMGWVLIGLTIAFIVFGLNAVKAAPHADAGQGQTAV